MAVRHHRDLRAWQLSDRVRKGVIQQTERDGIRSDGDFCGQARRAANSACRNLAEGFWRYSHREFAHFVNIARGSLGELIDSTDEALAKSYLSQRQFDELNTLITEALKSVSSLHRYLRTTQTPRDDRG
jgi:four helix bundle protein